MALNGPPDRPPDPNYTFPGERQPPVPQPPSTAPPPPGGFFNTPQAARAEATAATGKTYDAEKYTVDPKTGTVRGQMETLLDKGGSYLRRGETEGLQKAAERGLLNSSLSAGYAQGAMIDRALPIAQTDAGFYDKAMTNTANAVNAERQFNAQQANQIALENAKNSTQISALNAQESNKLTGLTLDANVKTSLALLDAGTKERLMTMDNNTKLLLQTNAAASDMYSNTVKNIADLTRDPSLSPEAKQAAVDNQLRMLNQGLQQLQAVSSSRTPQDLQLQHFFTKKGQVGRMTFDQQEAERERLVRAVRISNIDTSERRVAVDALNEFNAILAEVRANPRLGHLNIAEGFR